jgi:hypothetical protein
MVANSKPVRTDPTALDITTLVIAVLALTLSVAALVWQVVSWWLAGAIVRVTTRFAIGVGPVIGGARLIAINVRNVGRAAVSVEQWGLSLPSAHVQLVVPAPDPWMGPEVSHTLEGGHSQTWYFPLDQVQWALNASQLSEGEVFGIASLGTGKQIVAKQGVRVST